MNTTRNDALALASALTDAGVPQDVDVAIFPPSIWIEAVRRALGQNIHLGAQDCSAEVKGAFTGQVAAAQLRELCSMVIVGHSERRRDACESDDLVGRKAAAALAAGLTPIACVGESLEVREAGEAENVVGSQVDAIVREIGDVPASEFVLAYEPIWAIGTGRSASSEDAQSMCAFIRSRIGAGGPDVRILYGGSVVPDNAGAYLAEADVDGLLVGGASLKADQFLAIVAAC
jgi:triosephosphate isomerase